MTHFPRAPITCALALAVVLPGTAVATGISPGEPAGQSWLQSWTGHLNNDVLPFFTAQDVRSDSLVYRLRSLDVCAIAISREPVPAIRQQLRDKLERGLTEARRDFYDPQTGDWRPSATAADGPGASRTTADQAWATLLLADIHLRIGDAQALRLARATFERIDTLAHDEKLGGYFLSYPTDEQARDNHESSRKHAPTQLHVLLALVKLHLADPRDALIRSRLEELFLRIPLFASPETGHVRWALSRDWKPAAFERPINNQTLYGQNAETVTYLLAAADALGRPLDDILPVLEKITQGLMRDGISPGGAVYYLGPMNGSATDQRVWWWSQIETAAALWQMYQLTGDSRYLDTFNKVSAWAFAWFIPPPPAPRGCWRPLLSPDGTPLVADEGQTGYHAARSILTMLSPRSQVPASSP